MTSKEALEYVKMCCSDGLQLPQNQSLEQVKLIGASIETIEQDLEVLEKLEKAIEILKGTKNIEVYFFDNGKRHYRIKFDRTREQEIYQQDYKLLKEVLENDK